jgi:hypothetical protein
VQAVVGLVRHLRSAQSSFERETLAVLAPLPAASPAAVPCCSDLHYALKRLVRGLASTNDGSRQGYFLALTEVLQRFPNARTADVAARVGEAMAVTAATPRAEARNLYMGRVFATAALARAGRLCGAGDGGGGGGDDAAATATATATATTLPAPADPDPELRLLLAQTWVHAIRQSALVGGE